jgi:hypothetical protein
MSAGAWKRLMQHEPNTAAKHQQHSRADAPADDQGATDMGARWHRGFIVCVIEQTFVGAAAHAAPLHCGQVSQSGSPCSQGAIERIKLSRCASNIACFCAGVIASVRW